MECYSSIGRDYKNQDSQYHSLNWKEERKAIDEILTPNGIVFSFGWHSNGMQQSGSYQIAEMLIVAHGGAHNDTIVTVERKLEFF
ncbi:MAG: adenine-specific DNA methylase, partial [Pyrinomonadaceae bacterium]|nr:adenine-specific DNA methylase [Pyrinomonadaceae bacterium]